MWRTCARIYDEAGIRRYLLGLLPEPEAEALEHEYFARPDVLERVRAAEDDLLDDYAAGRLGAGEKESFESRYLAAPALRQRVVAARALRLAGEGVGRPAVTPFTAARLTRWLGPLALAAGLLLAVVAFWRWPSRAPEVTTASAPPASVARSEGPMPEPAITPAPGASPAAPPRAPTATTRIVFALSPVLLRGEGGPTELRIPPGAATVVLELEGDPARVPAQASRLDVAVQTVEGSRVWSGGARRLGDPERTSRLASIAVPATRLVAGDYLVTLSAGEEPIYRYFVRVRSLR
jgi:hypothetical protein